MKILITGGAGFLGARLALTLLKKGTLADCTGRQESIREIVLADLQPPPNPALQTDPRIRAMTGDLLAGIGAGLVAADTGAVFHLAAAVSGECEADFDLGMRANLDTTRALLDACRRTAHPPRLVFASSLAVYGGAMPEVIDDTTLPTPQSSYGIQKFCCEQLVADYTRKGFIDGRTVRLPTVAVRPGKPNRAASSFVSGILREPLAGLDALCPADPTMGVWITSPECAVAGLIAAHDCDRERWGPPTAVNLPGLSLRIADMIAALERAAGAASAARIRLQPDPVVERIVGGWPWRFHTRRAFALELPAPTTIDDLIAEYMRNHPEALASAAPA